MTLKHQLATAFEATGLNRLMLAAQRALLPTHVRAINYHDVPPAAAERFELQVRFYARHFEPVGVEELRELLAGRRKRSRPGLVLSFDDGLRSHADVVAPILEKHGFAGWFMVPTDFVDTPAEDQARFASEHHIQYTAGAFDDARIAMRWEDLRRLDGSHVIACHTRGHCRLHAGLTPAELVREIDEAKGRLEAELGREVPTFAWVGGEEESYSAAAAHAIREAGFELVFMTNNAPIFAGTDPQQLQRSNVEAEFSQGLLGLTLSGLYDLLYTGKRRRVNRLTLGAASPSVSEPPRS